jgi:hypothetical protein
MVHFTSSPLFQIRLENDTLIMNGSKTESVGCVLRGQLVLVITEPTKFKEIKLTFQGRSKVGWADGNYYFHLIIIIIIIIILFENSLTLIFLKL